MLVIGIFTLLLILIPVKAYHSPSKYDRGDNAALIFVATFLLSAILCPLTLSWSSGLARNYIHGEYIGRIVNIEQGGVFVTTNEMTLQLVGHDGVQTKLIELGLGANPALIAQARELIQRPAGPPTVRVSYRGSVIEPRWVSSCNVVVERIEVLDTDGTR